MIKFIVIYLYISTALFVVDIIKSWETITKYDEDLEDFSNFQLLFLASFVMICGVLTSLPYEAIKFIKRLGS